MATTRNRALIARAIERLQEELPSLKRLKLVARLELRARGGDAPIWRVEIPGEDRPRPGRRRPHRRVGLALAFNELATDGRLKHWAEAYEHGHLRVSGDAAVVKLLGNVIQRQLAER